MPSELEPIRARLVAQQDAAGSDAEVDYLFEVPLELFEAVTSCKVRDSEEPYEVLTHPVAKNAPRSILRRLFGRT